MDMKLELVAVPVSDVDRAKTFYVDQVGFNADHDHRVSDDLRFIQLTPPGSACSIAIGLGLTDAEPGSVRGLQMVVADAVAAQAELAARGVPVSEVQSMPWGEFVFFDDPDGNHWALQQLPPRPASSQGSSGAKEKSGPKVLKGAKVGSRVFEGRFTGNWPAVSIAHTPKMVINPH